MYSKFTICTVSLQYVPQTLCTTDMSDCWCDDLLCLQKVTVEAPPGKVAGYVCQSWSLCKPRMRIENAEGETVLRIKGPCCQLNICGDIEFDVSMMSSLLENFIKHWALKILLFWLFHWKNLIFDHFTFCLMRLLSVSQVYAPDEETYVGRVTKQWSGLGKELFTDADNFGISFPLDLDVNVKATLLGAVFLLVSVTFSINFIVYREIFLHVWANSRQGETIFKDKRAK